MSSSMPPQESESNERDTRVLFLNDTDHGGTTVQLEPSQQKVRVDTGATGDITVYLPPIDRVQIGTLYTINLVDFTTSDLIVDDGLADGLVSAFSAVTMTADGDYVVAQRVGDQWLRVTEKVGGAVAPA